MAWRVWYVKAGGHYHCDLYVAKERNQTFANSGHFVVSSSEFDSLRAVMSGVEFLEAK